MKYFVFRNNTIEPFFGNKEVEYSGYDDLSAVPEAENYLWFYQVPIKFDATTLQQELDGYRGKLQMVYSQIPAHKPFIIFTLESLFPLAYCDSSFAVRQAVRNFNDYIVALSQEHKNVKVVDFSEFVGRYAMEQLVDWKYYFISQTLLNPRLVADFKRWFSQKCDAIALKRKKCLVLDLDNTLWGGVLGEEGVDGIKIGGDYPGKAFLYFQEALLELSKQGVILAVCSKNNEADVLECWEKNPFNILRNEHFAAWRINWNNKADNIKELAQELNIGLDSFVFLDDNPTERELVKQVLPMVEVPDFPEQPYLLMPFLKEVVERYFKVYELTHEDLDKTAQYKANTQRLQAESLFTNFSDYLRSLEIRIVIEEANAFNLPRIAQMTQKTNQFNLTTRRYTEADIQSFISAGALVYCFGVADKFGDSGITGMTILKPTSATSMEIDSLLLSCRILGKGIEIAFVKAVLNGLITRGVTELTASYIPTKKNAQVADFYEKLGFLLVEATPDGTKHYTKQLTTPYEIDDYYTITIH